MKKILVILALVLLAGAALSAKDWHAKKGGTEYKKPRLVKAIGFRASFEDGVVKTGWKVYKRGDFLYYKVVKSSDNPDPVYPEDGAVFYTEDRGENSFIDSEVEAGVWYYRLCIITKKKDRWVSPVIAIRGEDGASAGELPSEKDFE